ncbi:MAG: acyl-CoA reductase [Pseudomonadota bacterium]
MSSEFASTLERMVGKSGKLLRLPALVKGDLEFPTAATPPAPSDEQRGFGEDPGVTQTEGAWFIPLSGTSSDSMSWQVLPRIAPERLLYTDPRALARDLAQLTSQDVAAYVGGLRDVLIQNRAAVEEVSRIQAATGFFEPALLQMFFAMLPALLDPDGLLEAVDRELGNSDSRGRDFLDGWVAVPAKAHAGLMARMSADGSAAATLMESRPVARAMPTRQLHITAGNAPVVPFVSFMRALGTRSACVIKSPAELATLMSLMGAAMVALDAGHPLTRYTSLVYWKGGDRSTEDVLLAPQAFDRLVVWGSPETVNSLASRAAGTKSILLNPRYGLSLIDTRPAGFDPTEVARLASIDTVIANQQACTASLVHYVVGDDTAVDRYCEALQAALQRWDELLPTPLPRSTLGQLRMLRRTALRRARWYVNGSGSNMRSAVARADEPFDVSQHPMARLVVVRPLAQPEDVVDFLTPAVSNLGIYPAELNTSLRDAAAACGVSNVLPLGEGERAYAGMPHDGMRVMSELVNWVNG